MKRIAVLDLGTNTFNLLIAESAENNGFKILLSEKRPVKLGEGGITKGYIHNDAITRGIQAIDYYYEKITQYKVGRLKAFGTSAFRTAQNGPDFLKQIKAKTGIDIEIVSGDREAELIYLGVKQTISLDNQKFLILDIGGGSNELVIADMHKIYWKKSYSLGIARLLEKFTPSDPLNSNEIKQITDYLKNELTDLFDNLKKNNICTLVGASGSFETFVQMIDETEVFNTEQYTEAISNNISLNNYNNLHQQLIHSTEAERRLMKGLEPMRIEMIVLASLFVKTLFDNHPFTQLLQSNFALKEGAIYELLNDI